MRDVFGTRFFSGILFLFLNASLVGVATGGTGDIRTVAGGGAGDGGLATAASLNDPRGVAGDSLGNVYIADTGNHRIRMLNVGTGVIETVAGDGAEGFSGAGLAKVKNLNMPSDVFVNPLGNMYIADTGNHRVRMVDTLGVMTTVAGTGEAGFSGDGGTAQTANLNAPLGVWADSLGNVYIADTGSHRIRMVDTLGVITTVAGNGQAGYSTDGIAATTASLNAPSDVFLDGLGTMYIADKENQRVRKVDSSGVITTMVGNGVPSSFGDDGPASDAQLNNPASVSLDVSGNLYITEQLSNRVRRVDGGTGIITTVLGAAGRGFSGDGGPASLARMDLPQGAFTDASGNLYVADTRNNRVRKVTGTGVITTVAGSGAVGTVSGGFFGDGLLATNAVLDGSFDVFIDGTGSLYLTDQNNHRVRRMDGVSGMISTVAGDGTAGFFQDGVAAVETGLNAPSHVVVDVEGNLYFADTDNHRIRKVHVDSGTVETIAGNGREGYSGDGGAATTARIHFPLGFFLDISGNLYIADTGNNRVRKVDGKTGIITTIAGTGAIGVTGGGFSGDGGPATEAGLRAPSDVFVDGSGTIYIVDAGNNRVRKVDPRGVISTVVGIGTAAYSGDGEPGKLAGLNAPSSIFVDASGSLFISDTGNRRVRKVDPLGIITTVGGNGSQVFSGDGGLATESALGAPNGLFVGVFGDLYVADQEQSRIRRIEGVGTPTVLLPGVYRYPNNGEPPVLLASWPVEGAQGIDPNLLQTQGVDLLFSKPVDTDRVQVQVVSTAGSDVWQTTWLDGNTRLTVHPQDLPGFKTEYRVQLTQLADTMGNVAEDLSLGFTTRVEDQPVVKGNIVTVAGTGESGFSGDGSSAADMRLSGPSDVAVDQHGNLFIADTGNNRVRKVDAKTGLITTVAGNGTAGDSGDGGPATGASLDGPVSVAVDSAGNVYIADRENNRVRKVDANTGEIQTIAGSGMRGFSGDGGPATGASLDGPVSVAVDSAGNVYVADRRNARVRKVDANTNEIQTIAGSGSTGFSGDGVAATEAKLTDPRGVFVDGNGSVYVADGDRVRKVAGDTGAISTVAGGAAPGSPLGDGGPATDAGIDAEDVFVDDEGNVYVSDAGRVRKVDAKTGEISTLAGTGNLQGFLGDGGPAKDASMSAFGVFVGPNGDLYLADQRNHRVRKIEQVGTPEPPSVVYDPADFNEDTKVDFSDFVLFARGYGKSEEHADFEARLDLDGNKAVGFSDFVRFSKAFAESSGK